MHRIHKTYFTQILSAALFAVVFLNSSSFATWKKLATLPAPITACFFLNPSYGVIGTGVYGASNAIGIYITTDGGVTWTLASTPVGGVVTQIAINPNGTGYASIYSLAAIVNLLKTTDGGYSWTDISSGSHFGTGVGLNGQTAQWVTTGPAATNTNGVFTMPGGNTIITPGPGGGGMGEAWGAYGDSIHKIWYMITELSRQLFISTDLGVTWKLRFNFGSILINGALPTGDIYGSGSSLYIQTDKLGLFRGSINDTGGSWIPIGGPPNVVDSRTIYSSGCSGQNILAFDNTGTLWVSDDGGDGALSLNDSLNIRHIKFPGISSCTNDTKFATITSHGCMPFVITSVSLINNPSGVYTLLPPITLPDTLASGMTDTFYVKFDPKFSPGTYNAQIRVKGYFEAGFGTGTKSVDSIINISGLANVEGPKVQIDYQQIDFGDVGICGGEKDSIFTITNIGCDTLKIETGPGQLDSAFTVINPSLPLSLAPDSVFTIHVRFKPLVAGPVSSDLLYHLSAEGSNRDITFHVQGNGVAGAGLLSFPFSTLDFDTVSICLLDSMPMFFTNTGCGSLVVTKWELIGCFITGDPWKIGSVLLPGDTIHNTIHLGDAHTRYYKGADTGHFFVELLGGQPQENLYISVKGFIGDGSHVLTANSKAIDFGTTSLCEGKDTSIILHNTGCDTLHINDARVSGLGFVVAGYSYPIIIPPDSSTTIRIFTVLDTVGGKTLMQDSLIIVSNSDSSFAPITLSRRVKPVREVGMYLDATSQSGTAYNFATYTLKETPGKSFIGAGVKSVGFDLAYNTDLLEFVQAKSSANLGSSDGKHFTITSSGSEIDADANGILASLAFQVYLTKDSTTTIGLNNVTLNGIDSIASPCGMLLSFGGSANFDYQYFCGERSIASSMRGENVLEINSIAPNPARDEIEIQVRSSQKQDALVETFDALGAKVFSEMRNIEAGSNRVQIDTKGLSGGMYLVRVGNASQSFVTVR
ncbi:MAG: choice-of-anchor D domain-containing protein [Candidatus Kapaibacterium sp.]